jgi:uncharacterized protein YacL
MDTVDPIAYISHNITAILWLIFVLGIFYLGLRIRKQGENIKAKFVNETYSKSLILVLIFATLSIFTGLYLLYLSNINIFELTNTTLYLYLKAIFVLIAYLMNIYQFVSKRNIKDIDRYLNANIRLLPLIVLFLFLASLFTFLAT